MNYFRNLIQKLNKKSNKKSLTYLTNHVIINMKGGKTNMEKLTQLVQATKTQKFSVSKDKIKQTERNALKSDILNALQSDLENGVSVVGRAKEGIIIALQNDNEGAIYGVLDVVIKDFTFEPEILIDEYENAQADKIAKAQAQALKRAKA